MHTGGKDTNKLGVAAVIRSDWRFSRTVNPRIPRGLRRGQYRVSPYTGLYRTYEAARRLYPTLKRPTVAQVLKLQRRRKA